MRGLVRDVFIIVRSKYDVPPIELFQYLLRRHKGSASDFLFGMKYYDMMLPANIGGFHALSNVV